MNQPLLSKEILMDLLHMHAEDSAEELRHKLSEFAGLAHRASSEFEFILIRRRADPYHMPPVEDLLNELEMTLNKCPEETPVRDELFHNLAKQNPNVRWMRARKG